METFIVKRILDVPPSSETTYLHEPDEVDKENIWASSQFWASQYASYGLAEEAILRCQKENRESALSVGVLRPARMYQIEKFFI